MKESEFGSPSPSELRQRAEKALREAPARTTPAGATEPDQPRLSHELAVHQIELEMQNEELKRANDQTATLLAEFCDLYDFAPVGYFTLDNGGVIRKANLAGAALLGAPRVTLAGRRLAPFLAPESYREFADFLASVMSGREGLACEVNLPRKGGGTARVHLDGKAFDAVPECRVTMVDVTEQARAKELRDAHWRLESIIEGTHIGTWEWNVQTGAKS